ncbi:hypothetical protein CDAR_168661 [Caerostris darwini]|uniref:Ribosomal protein L2 n=1 Tax=Caerostris darwini TaxID=1538125 RepID=A0AAV4T7W6_9ARAC|nr:hypothetical protein CDAR_168661 [Caerostris darwini]
MALQVRIRKRLEFSKLCGKKSCNAGQALSGKTVWGVTNDGQTVVRGNGGAGSITFRGLGITARPNGPHEQRISSIAPSLPTKNYPSLTSLRNASQIESNLEESTPFHLLAGFGILKSQVAGEFAGRLNPVQNNDSPSLPAKVTMARGRKKSGSYRPTTGISKRSLPSPFISLSV